METRTMSSVLSTVFSSSSTRDICEEETRCGQKNKNETTRQCFRKSISALDATSISQFLGRSNSYSTCKDDHFLHFFIFLSRLDGNGCHNRETSPMAILERASKALPAIMNTHSLRAFPCWARFSNVFNDSANAIFKVSI